MKAGFSPVSLIPADLERDEFANEIVNTFQYITKVSDIIFQRLDCKLGDVRARLDRINQRAEAARVKVAKITGSTKALRVSAPIIVQNLSSVSVHFQDLNRNVQKFYHPFFSEMFGQVLTPSPLKMNVLVRMSSIIKTILLCFFSDFQSI